MISDQPVLPASGITEAPARVHSGDELSAEYVMDRIDGIERRVRMLVSLRKREDPGREDQFRGLYLSEEHVDRLLVGRSSVRTVDWDDPAELQAVEERADVLERDGRSSRLRSLARTAGLDGLDVDLLLVVLAPDLDCRFEQLYGYLNDDVIRRRATVGLCLELCRLPSWSAEGRSRFHSSAPLISKGLVTVEEKDRPFLSRSLTVPDRVASHLLGVDLRDSTVSAAVRQCEPEYDRELVSGLASVLADDVRLIYLRERPGVSAPGVATAAFASLGLGTLALDLSCVVTQADLSNWATIVGREALLTGSGVVLGPIEAALDCGHQSIRAFSAIPVPVVLHGRVTWEPSWSRTVPLTVELMTSSSSARLNQWEHSLRSDAAAVTKDAEIITQFVLSGDQVVRAVESARLDAQYTGKPLGLEHLRKGARAQNGAGLDRLARRVQSTVGWDDLVLTAPTFAALRELAERARYRDKVLDQWGMRPGGGRGRGITALFAGDSGTGKTMSAEVVAGHLGFDLYTVNLATVVDKYVGETEKNLERIFTEADGMNAVILFDEADALFGKRSAVREANDRYANIEVAYLLQRMETFDGLAILATNLRTNVDDAFARRLDMIVEFPAPDGELRRALWEHCLASGVPRADDLDLEFCAQAFELSGGNIRSVAISAAYLAAGCGRPVTMADIIRAVDREYRKLGRLVVASEFGPYFELTGAT
jgi:hypothetical protein